ncbi:protein-tyrosine-phosphatase [Lachnospiraceae bacterium JC7]|nr:protein-tyrosine-phosphatase [Lachnospiraceae bacterium JC7]
MIRILFVCHGNICRSVSAEYIMKYLIEDRSDSDVDIYIDSAATSLEEIGNQIYLPMRKTLEAHKIPIGNHRARRIEKSEYDDFDLIIAMDEENMYNLNRLFNGDPQGKVHYLMEYTDTQDATIEDPWYTRRFENVYKSILDGCTGLLEKIRTHQI